MALQYKIDVLAQLKEKGYSTFRLRQERLLSEGAIQSLRTGASISWANLGRLCDLLNCQPGDIIENVYEPNKPTPKPYDTSIFTKYKKPEESSDD